MSGTDRAPRTVVRALMLLFAIALLLHLPSAPAAAQTAAVARNVYAITADNQLVRFSSATPATVSTPLALTGLQSGESILGIDIRPATGELFALGSSNRLYTINPGTGAATQVGTGTFVIPLAGTDFGFDFNPTVDRIRVVSDSGQNLRLNPNDGTVVDSNTSTAGVQPDGAINGVATGLVAAGYITNFAAAQSTVLYGIDATGDQLVTVVPPNNGTTIAVGPLGVNTTNVAGFDIVGTTNQAFVALTPNGATGSVWYTLNLATGALTSVGAIGVAVKAIAVVPPATPDMVYALTASNKLLTFRSSAPGIILDTITPSGLPSGETLVGIDFRPATGQLYGLGSSSRLYTISTQSGAATVVGTAPFTTTLSGTAFGFDFNPVPDRIRIVSDQEQNLRANPANGALVIDGTLAYAPGDSNAGANPNVAGAGYTNNFSGTTTTQLFVVDTTLNILALQNPPNNGVLTTRGPLGLDVTDQFGLDISRDGAAYVSYAAPGATSSSFGTINTVTGAISPIGPIGPTGTELIRDIAVPTWQNTRYLPVILR